MDLREFERVAQTFASFHAQFARFFGRTEARRRSEQYLRGLLSEAPWETMPVIDALQGYLAPRFTATDGVFVLDETGFPKKGTKSVGVARQYCGTLGKVGNCQLGVFLAYVSKRGHALIDTRLFLPREWADDPARCRAGGVPDAGEYQSKAELGMGMLQHAHDRGQLAGRWVTADADYGKVPSLRDTLGADGWWYVLEVPSTTLVFVEEAQSAVPAWSGRGHKPTRPRLVEGTPRAQPVPEWVAGLAPERWHVLTVAEGAQGPRTYQVGAQRVWESRAGVPGLARGSVLADGAAGVGKKSARPDPAAGRSGAAGVAPPADLDRRRPLAVVA